MRYGQGFENTINIMQTQILFILSERITALIITSVVTTKKAAEEGILTGWFFAYMKGSEW